MNIQKKIILVVSGVLLVSVVVLQLLKDSDNPGTESDDAITDPYLLEGKRLSEIYCSSCHSYPVPELLPQRTWQFATLPAMEPFLGMNLSTMMDDPGQNPNLPANVYPSGPQLTQKEWKQIQDYYLHAAPEEWLLPEKDPEIIVDSLFFRTRVPAWQPDTPPGVTSVKFDPANRLIYLSDFNARTFMVLNSDLDLEHHANVESPVSSIQMLNDGPKPGFRELLLTFIGHLQPSDAPYGSVQQGWYNPELQESGFESVILDSIVRPV